MKLSNKVALVTGGLKGIGRATVMELATQGADIALNYRASEKNKVLAEELVKELKDLGRDVLCVEGDISHEEDVEKIFKSIKKYFGHLDILVNNAGVSDSMMTIDCNPEHFQEIINLNVNAVFNAIQPSVELMKEQGGGCIINTSSMVSKYGQPGGVAYPTSKFGVNGLTISLARELGQYGIRVNAVAPGITRTDMVAALPEEEIQPLIATIPLGRIGEPEDVANACFFLASELASYVSGEILAVDGATIC